MHRVVAATPTIGAAYCSSVCLTFRCSPGKEKNQLTDIIKGVEAVSTSLAMVRSRSTSNVTTASSSGGQLFYEIKKNGKIACRHAERRVAYQTNSQDFWNSCVAIADQNDYRLGGAFGDGKGQSHPRATLYLTGLRQPVSMELM